MNGRLCSGLIAAALLAGCAGTPVDRSVLARMRPAADFGEPAEGAATGFATQKVQPLRAGDRARFGLLLQTGESVRRWFVEIELLATPGDDSVTMSRQVTVNEKTMWLTSRLVDVEVTVFDGGGAVLRKSTASVGELYLARGLVAVAKLVREQGWTMQTPAQTLSDDETRMAAESLLALTTLFDTVAENDALSPLLWEVVETPSVWSIVTSLGVSVSVQALFDQTDFTAPAVLGSGPTAAIPLTILANDAPALLCTLFATDPRPPFRLCAGIVAIEGVHPTDATRRFSMRLLSVDRPSD